MQLWEKEQCSRKERKSLCLEQKGVSSQLLLTYIQSWKLPQSLCGVKHPLNHWKDVSWVGKKLTGSPRDLDTNNCLMIFREMLDSLEEWESAWSAPLENSTTGTQARPHTPTHPEPPKKSLFYFLTWARDTKWQGSRFSKEWNCLW